MCRILNYSNFYKRISYLLKIFMIISLIGIIASCDSGYTKDDESLNSAILDTNQPELPTDLPVTVSLGTFRDSAVAGINFESGGQQGVTDSNGTFKYEEGQNVTFSVGGVVIGSGPPSSEMTPVDIVEGGSEDNQAVVNIARFLQTLDDDGDPTNGIGISSTTADAIKSAGKSIVFNVAPSTFTENTDVLEVVEKVSSQTGREVELVSETKAKSHLQDTVMQVKKRKGISAPGIRLSKTQGKTAESGENFLTSVWLNSSPSQNVSLLVSSSDITEGTVSPSSLTFTSNNWETPQTLTVKE